jgi:hypothetical protein
MCIRVIGVAGNQPYAHIGVFKKSCGSNRPCPEVVFCLVCVDALIIKDAKIAKKN